MVERWDIVIVGGGPAGATAGCLLAASGRRVLICEGKNFPREKVCGEFMGTKVRGVLSRLDLLEEFDSRAGPWVKRVMAFSGDGLLGAMPVDAAGAWPRAMARGELDAMLLHRAHAMGAIVWQPCHVTSVTGSAGAGFDIKTSCGDVRAPVVVLAHGQPHRSALSGEDPPTLRRQYVSFKTHMEGCTLMSDTIAIGGATGMYAGVVQTSAPATVAQPPRFSLAFVVRRENITHLGNSPDRHLALLCTENAGFARLLRAAHRIAPWLSSGPLEPGMRTLYKGGRFFVGNAAGEVHALIGEGITLAMRGGELLAETLLQCSELDAAGDRYARQWKREFAWRYGAAQVFANLMMRPALSQLAGNVLREFPELMDACIRTSGK